MEWHRLRAETDTEPGHGIGTRGCAGERVRHTAPGIPVEESNE